MLYSVKGNMNTKVIEHSFMLTILHKSMEWSTQNEWRFVLTPDYLVDNNPVKVGNISKVFLGAKMSNYERKKIIDICIRKGYECYEMKMQKDKYALSTEKIL